MISTVYGKKTLSDAHPRTRGISARLLATGMCTLLMTAPVSSMADGFYLGAGYGQSKFFSSTSICEELQDEAEDAAAERAGDELFDTAFALLINGTECKADNKDSAAKIFAGYRFNPYVAVEAAYVDFGEVSADLSTNIAQPIGTLNGSGSARLSADGFSIGGLFGVPIGERVGLYARLGIIAWDAKASGQASGTVRDAAGRSISRSENFSMSESDVDVNYGAGVRVKLTEHVALRADYERYEVMDIDMISASIEVFPAPK